MAFSSSSLPPFLVLAWTSILLLPRATLCLDNGLALTPPMGWMSWERFRCNIDCENDPDNCISEDLFKQQAQAMVDKGFLDAGYEYIIIDDCWLAHERDEDGKLQPDPDRFPSGIPALAQYIHDLGLKFGIYEDYGNYTCGGYPGILGHLETDANTFAEWGVDYIKVDGCYADIDDFDEGYPAFGAYLNATGRPIVYSCSWPAYWPQDEVPDYPLIQESCNLWRNYGDIQDSWADVLDIVDHYGDEQDDFAQYAGPGSWNDPDMLIIGDFALSPEQSRVQMALWAVLASPLIMSNDLRDIGDDYVAILQNRDVIAVNQDSIGHQGRRVYKDTAGGIDIFVKNINPVSGDDQSAAVAVMYRGIQGTPVKVTVTPEQLGLVSSGGYSVTEVFEGADLGSFAGNDEITVSVNPNGVQLLRFEVNSSKSKRVPPHVNDVRSQQQRQHSSAAAAAVKKTASRIEVEDVGRTGWYGEL